MRPVECSRLPKFRKFSPNNESGKNPRREGRPKAALGPAVFIYAYFLLGSLMKILHITPRPGSAVSSVVEVQIPMAHSICNWAYGIYGRLCGIWGMRNTPAPLYMPLYYRAAFCCGTCCWYCEVWNLLAAYLYGIQISVFCFLCLILCFMSAYHLSKKLQWTVNPFAMYCFVVLPKL